VVLQGGGGAGRVRRLEPQRRTETVYQLLLRESVGHSEQGDGAGLKVRVALDALPDLRVTVADGDNVVVRWSASGTPRQDAIKG
jgi:hypothetical protein